MKKMLFFWKNVGMLGLILLVSIQAISQMVAPPMKGDGTAGYPYEIASLDNLFWLSQNTTEWNKNYIQVVNIDARTTKNWDSGAGFSPIGNSITKFTGTYNGQGHVIDSLYINRASTSYIGLFGNVDSGARIDHLGLTDLEVTGEVYVGGLVGFNKGNIDNCYTTGIGTATTDLYAFIGGLIGYNGGRIHKSFSKVNAVAKYGNYVGGFVGRNFGITAVISDCYSMGNITGEEVLGGFAGENNKGASIINCYCNGKITAFTTAYIGGFVGANWHSAVIASFWNVETSGQATSIKGKGLTTVAMRDIKTYLIGGWDFMGETVNGEDDTWGIISTENGGYPFLIWQGYTNDIALMCKASLFPITVIVSGDYLNSITKNIDDYLLDLSNKIFNLHILSTLTKRKIKVKGKFDNGSKIFKQKIKYYKSGLKKEVIKIEYLGKRKPVTLLKLVLINDEYISIHKVSYSDEEYFNKISEEKLIDGKVYKKTDYDNKMNETKNTYSWRKSNN